METLPSDVGTVLFIDSVGVVLGLTSGFPFSVRLTPAPVRFLSESPFLQAHMESIVVNPQRGSEKSLVTLLRKNAGPDARGSVLIEAVIVNSWADDNP